MSGRSCVSQNESEKVGPSYFPDMDSADRIVVVVVAIYIKIFLPQISESIMYVVKILFKHCFRKERVNA